MKRAFRTLSLLLCCALLLTAVPDVSAFMPVITALAEDEAQQATPEPQAEAPAATDAPEATQAPEITEAPAETDAPEVTEAPAETEAPQETQAPEATETPEVTPLPIDYTLDADKNPAFESGYVQLKSAVTVYEGAAASDDEIARLSGGVAYAVKRSAKEPDRLQIVFNDGSDALAKGWIDADRARPMNPETESLKFAESAAKDAEMQISTAAPRMQLCEKRAGRRDQRSKCGCGRRSGVPPRRDAAEHRQCRHRLVHGHDADRRACCRKEHAGFQA